jgi:hypothetical protein
MSFPFLKLLSLRNWVGRLADLRVSGHEDDGAAGDCQDCAWRVMAQADPFTGRCH